MNAIATSDFVQLEWDSEFFGFKVAKILPQQLNEQKLKQILDALRDLNVRLAYWATDSKYLESFIAGNALGGFLADNRTVFTKTLSKELIASYPNENLVLEYTDKVVTEDLLELGLESGKYSRFKMDPHFQPGKFTELYTRWVNNSINKTFADAVFVIYNENKTAIGFASCVKKNNIGEFGLFAIAAPERRKGYAKALMRAMERYSFDQNCTGMRAIGQWENVAGRTLYSQNGYELIRCENFFHFWL